ncbi:MAG TPA: glycosyl hydrolase family 18 protein [Bacteroidia bacterium]
MNEGYGSISTQQEEPDDTTNSRYYFSKISDAHKKYFEGTNNLLLRGNIKYPGKFTLKKDISVFGWHVYWKKDSYTNYNYSLLTHVAYFCCAFDPVTGAINEWNGWDTSSIVKYVKQQNPACKVLLTVTNFGQKANATFLSDTNERAQDALIQELFETITNKKADGVCVNFEQIPSSRRDAFTRFINKLREKFTERGKLVSITLPAVERNPSPFDFDVLQKPVDLFILMGYDYFGAFSKNAGPIAPLKKSAWIPNSVEGSVTHYLSDRHVPGKKLLLGVPYYGGLWNTQSTAVPSGNCVFEYYRSYSYSLTSGIGSLIIDTVLKTSHYAYPYKENNKPQISRQLWLDTEYSLGAKYDYVLNKQLGGIGIWALGFDDGSDRLWHLLETKFAVGVLPPEPSIPLPVKPTDSQSTWAKIKQLDSASKLFLAIKARPNFLGISLLLLLVTLLVVLIKIFSSPINRDKLKSSGLFYLFFLVIATLFAFIYFVLLLICFKVQLLTSSIGFAIVILLIGVVTYIKTQRNKEMP